MKCNLPGNYKAKDRHSEAVFLDAPVEHKTGVEPKIDRVQLPKGYEHRPMMKYGTGNTNNFTNSARSRRNEKIQVRDNAMKTARAGEGVRILQRNQSSEESEM